MKKANMGKYCSCLVKVSKKQSNKCLKNKSYGKNKCYNPYAICTKSLKRKGIVNCGKILNYNNLLKTELFKYAIMKGKNVNMRMRKQEIINVLNK